MIQKVLIGLLLLTVAGLGLLLSFLLWGPEPAPGEPPNVVIVEEGKSASRQDRKSPPPAAPRVDDQERVRQSLQQGKAYHAELKGVIRTLGEDTAWAVRRDLQVLYVFECVVVRTIESNDGTEIVERRLFQRVRSLKALCSVDDVRLVIGPAGEMFLPNEIFKASQKVTAKPLLAWLKRVGVNTDKLGEEVLQAYSKVDALEGKEVRLRYTNGQGVARVEAIKGKITAEELDYHLASVSVSDALIFPNPRSKPGDRWSAPGVGFSNMIDPTLKACVAGEVELERIADEAPPGEDGNPTGEVCACVKIRDGRLRLDGSNANQGEVGHFDPRGKFWFSPTQQIVSRAVLEGAGRFQRFSKDHLLFQTRMSREPTIQINYTCRMAKDPPRRERQ